MKKVKYSVYQKLIITMMSIVIGCETSKDINEKLGVEKLALNTLDIDTILHQSQINELIRRFDSDSINQLEDIHNSLFIENSNSTHSHTRVVVDWDQSGLIANGKTFELAEKGYFPKKKNQRGYQLAAVFTGEHSETVAMFLDSGSSRCTDHYDELLNAILSKYKNQLLNDFLWLVFITHNLISWFKSTALYGTKLENVRVRVLAKTIGGIKGFVKMTPEGIKEIFLH